MAPRRSPTTAEVHLVTLRNCLVNLPPILAGTLADANTPAQNVVVELQYRQPKIGPSSPPQSVFLGWTGFASKHRPSLTSTRQSIRDPSYASSTGPTETPSIELDSSFARTLNIPNGAKVGVLLHVDPVVAHTVHIDPLTPADWEIIELHPTFLETNLQAQIRALPNPTYTGASRKEAGEGQTAVHPLTIHLSPTSTANVVVTQLTPPLPKDVPFAKLKPDAEVIVAPKTRQRVPARSGKDSTSVVSGSVRSGRTSNTTRQRSQRSEGKRPIFVRGVDEHTCPGLVDHQEDQEDDEDHPGIRTPLRIWVDSEMLASSRSLRGADWVAVSIVRPASLQPVMDAQQMQRLKDVQTSDAGGGSSKIVARLVQWNDSPSRACAVLSTTLCEALAAKNMAGSILRLESAPAPAPSVRSIKVYPFSSAPVKQHEGLKFGGETRAAREIAAQRFKKLFGSQGSCNVLNGPLSDGLPLPIIKTADAHGWNGGLVRLDGLPALQESEKGAVRWTLAAEDNLQVEVQQEIPSPLDLKRTLAGSDESIPTDLDEIIGVEGLFKNLLSHTSRGSSILLNGGLGSGKTVTAQTLGNHLRRESLYQVLYFPCRKLVTDETRVSAIKDTFNKLFMQASWGARLGGRSLVILDDLDKLCPAEQELQVGNDNARSRQISELLCTIVRQHCAYNSGVTLVATSQGKDSLHNTVVGGHILPETVDLKAPDKDKRRRILEGLARENGQDIKVTEQQVNGVSEPSEDGSWIDTSAPSSRPTSSLQHDREEPLQDELDFLDIAGQTDGYMPGDLCLLFARAKSEALIRTISDQSSAKPIRLIAKDFERALDGFTPASLRNVTLQSSSTTFASIGGLQETRKTLLETLQYPTTYAPIFAQCPLRLRSGLLLYGYPGCGKTLLASAVAGECGLNFISVKGPEILNKYIGASEKSVRDLFERAQAARPCVLFFDEFDSIAPKRGHDSTGVTDRVVNQLLTQMDGAEGLSGVYVLAATSRPDLIDPALLRPGRLDKSLLCDMPSEEDRLDILRALSTKLKMENTVASSPPHSPFSLSEVARRTEGYSGADLQAVIYNAHLEAIHDVLGDHGQDATSKTRAPSKSGKPPPPPPQQQQRHNSISSATNAHSHELIQFRYGVDEDKRASAALTGAKAASERSALMAKLEVQRLTRRREREARRGGGAGAGMMASSQLLTNGSEVREADQDGEPIIAWKHIEKSLATTRSSISAQERMKLQAIYNEFVQGRNGEMPSGQGPTEIGARSSLM